MPHLITNAIVVTNDSHGTIHHSADILVSGNRIEAIAPAWPPTTPAFPTPTRRTTPSSPASPISTPTSS